MLPEARTAYSPGPPVDCMRHAGVHAVTVPPAPPAWYVTVVPRAMLSPAEHAGRAAEHDAGAQAAERDRARRGEAGEATEGARDRARPGDRDSAGGVADGAGRCQCASDVETVRRDGDPAGPLRRQRDPDIRVRAQRAEHDRGGRRRSGTPV